MFNPIPLVCGHVQRLNTYNVLQTTQALVAQGFPEFKEHYLTIECTIERHYFTFCLYQLCRPQPDVDIMIHVTALEDMAAKLIDLGINITEHDLITTIICSISPVGYESLLGAWENVPDAERTMTAQRDRFLLEQQ